MTHAFPIVEMSPRFTPRRKPRRADANRDCVVDARLLASRSATSRLLEAIQAGTDEYIISSTDGRVSIRVSLSLLGVEATEHRTANGRLTVDWSRSRVSHGDSRVTVSRTELRLLAALLEGEGEPVSRAKLIERIWPNDRLDVSDRENALGVYVHSLRKRLKVIGLGSALETVRGKGYRMGL